MGPAVLRKYKIVEEIKKLGWGVIDKGDVTYKVNMDQNEEPDHKGIKHPKRVGDACEKLYNLILKSEASSHFVLTLGGDHSLAMGSITALAKSWEGLSIVWVDAHGDINTDKTTGSGNLHGMPVAFLLGLVKGVPGFEWLHDYIDPKRIVYIGLRHVDFLEKKTISSYGIKAYSMHEVNKYGIGKVTEMALDHVDPKRKRPLHLSFDIDSLDPYYCPSTGTKVAGGLTYREGIYICEAMAQTGRLVSMDVTEFNPAIGTTDEVTQTAEITISLVRAALGLEVTVDQI